jgi:TonB family protein
MMAPAPPPINMAPPAPPPPPPRGISAPARARANLASLISVEDYPAAALRAREEGMVGFRLEVGPNGRVSNCAITQSSNSPSLDSTTCRLLTSRARFTPAQDSLGNPATGTVSGRVLWRIVNDFDRPWAPALFVEEMRSTAAGAVTCREGWDSEPVTDEACPAGEAVQLAARARAAGTALTQSLVTKLTPEGMSEATDRPSRGDPYLAADAIFTIGADGKLLECRLVRNTYLGRRHPAGRPPNPCADWDVGTNSLYLPAAEGQARRTVKVTIRGYVGAPAGPEP